MKSKPLDWKKEIRVIEMGTRSVALKLGKFGKPPRASRAIPFHRHVAVPSIFSYPWSSKRGYIYFSFFSFSTFSLLYFYLFLYLFLFLFLFLFIIIIHSIPLTTQMKINKYIYLLHSPLKYSFSTSFCTKNLFQLLWNKHLNILFSFFFFL